MPGILSGFAAPLRLVTIDARWSTVRGGPRCGRGCLGICGSDLGALSGQTSLVLLRDRLAAVRAGHEVVAELLEDCEDLAAGTRSCSTRC
jgi:hypothetical protein